MKLEVKNFPTLEKETETAVYEHLHENACKLAEQFFQTERELGYGQTANIYNTTEESNICLKRLNQKELKKYPFMNNLEEEADFLERVHKIITPEDNIKVPLPIVIINSEKEEVVERVNLKGEKVCLPVKIRENILAMERINGPSLADIFSPKEQRFKKPAPEGIDWNIFFRKLKTFVTKMNDLGIFHRDLHKGNIMIDPETHNPVIIDFGFARKKFFDDEEVFQETDYRQETTRFIPDLDMIESIKKEIL